MACATLKRPLEWSDPSMSPPSAHNSGHKDSHHSRAAKRRCISSVITPQINKDVSHFGDVQPILSQEEIAVSIREEMRRLQNRKRLQMSQSSSTFCASDVSLIGHRPQSPLNTNSQDGFSSPTHEMQSLSSTSIGLLSPSRRDAPLFTFRQVGLICERILKEREAHIRQEYDDVLNTKLAEQYDTFVKFTYDQIQKRFENGTIPSYLS